MWSKETWEAYNSVLSFWALGMPVNQRIVDFGSGDGDISRATAKAFSASFLHMVDPNDAPIVEQGSCPEKYWRQKAGDKVLLDSLRGQVDTITAVFTIHELVDPKHSVAKILSLFPKDSNGAVLFVDFHEKHWTEENIVTLPEEDQKHARRDKLRVMNNRLFHQEDIQAFWKNAFNNAGLKTPTIGFPEKGNIYFVLLPGEGPLWDAPVEIQEDSLTKEQLEYLSQLDTEIK